MIASILTLCLFTESFTSQAYLEMQTTVGPSPDEVISPFILAFDPAADPLLTAVE